MQSTAAIVDEPTDQPDLAEARPASIGEIEVADPTGEEVLVEVTAASLCHTDVASARGHLTERCPYVMGHEGTGVVREVGGDVESVEPGQQVVLGRITCGRCAHCRAGAGQHCVKRTEAGHLGSLRTGAVRFSRNGDPLHHYHGVSSFSEYTLVTEEVAVPVPAELPPEQATLLGCGVFTGAGATMNTADVEAGASVVVFGAGGVGLSAVQGARIRGATEIVAVDVVPEKLEIAEAVGATATVDAGSVGDPVQAARDACDGGADYAIEAVGDERVVEQAVGVLETAGTAVLVGVPPEGARELALDLHDVVVEEKSLVGSFNGSYSLPLAIPRLAELAVEGHLLLEPLVTDSRPLSEVNEAMQALEDGTGVRQLVRT